MRMTVTLATLAAALGTTSARQPAQRSESPALASPADRCMALVGDYPAIEDAPTRITTARPVAAGALVPAYCDVTATIKPQIGIGIRLPLGGWNGKVLYVARGGYCRPVQMQECDSGLRKGYACAISDQGHDRAGEQDDVWASGNLQGQVDCGFRGGHVAAATLKAVTTSFYRKRPRRAYMTGCSTGGRMSLVEAEKFPYDFDGIVAGAPPVSKAGSSLTLAWTILALRARNGSALFSPADFHFVAGAAKAQCDAADGLADGVIGSALSCRVDTKKLACRAGQTSSCLTPEQVAGLDEVYRGPHTPDGKALTTGAPLPGSEMGWIDAFATRPGGTGGVEQSMTALFSHLNDPVLAPGWKLESFDWSRDYKRSQLFEAYNDASNPDLSSFRDNGGKLLLYHGLADPFIAPGTLVDWFRKVQALSGPARTADFARLFLMPGMGHCSGGDGPDRVDLLDAIDAWVDQGKAPDRLIAAKVKPGTPALFPLTAAAVEYRRPLYPWPAVARYDGKGDPAQIESFPPSVQ